MSTRSRRKPSSDQINGKLLRHLPMDSDAWSKVKRVACASGDSPQYFSDDVHTTCAGCGITIFHRPYIPTTITKVCLTCATRSTSDSS